MINDKRIGIMLFILGTVSGSCKLTNLDAGIICELLHDTNSHQVMVSLSKSGQSFWMDERGRIGALCHLLDDEFGRGRCQISAGIEGISNERELQELCTPFEPQFQLTWLSYLERARHDLEVSLRKIPRIPDRLIIDTVYMNNAGMCIGFLPRSSYMLHSREFTIIPTEERMQEILPNFHFLREHRTNNFVFGILQEKIQAQTAELAARPEPTSEEQIALNLSKEAGRALEELIQTANYRNVILKDTGFFETGEEDVESRHMMIHIGDIVYNLSFQDRNEVVGNMYIEGAVKRGNVSLNFPAELREGVDCTCCTFGSLLCKPNLDLDRYSLA